jgi:NADPH-dependent 2,4-dienoyl-CoA reductase/sulfur reductase-like enzyme
MKIRASISVLLFAALALPALRAEVVLESARRLPVAAQVDVVVVGGTTGAVAAALEAERAGRSVYLVAPRPFLGEDLGDTLRLWPDAGEPAAGSLAARIFAGGGPVAPLRVKKTLEEALLERKISFLLTSYATDLLVDAVSRPAGVVIANRSGRQAIVAKVIIDATDEAVMARQAGARRHTWSGGPVELHRVVLGGKPAAEEAIRRRVAYPAEKQTCFEYAVTRPLPDTGWRALVEAEHALRDLTSRPGQARASARVFFVPPDPVVGERGASAWKGWGEADPGHFQPAGVERLYLLGSRADVPRAVAAQLQGAVFSERAGRLVGAAAARAAAGLAAPRDVRLRGGPASPVAAGDVRENLGGLRPVGGAAAVTIPAEARPLPVLGRYDVVIVGGGTSGAAAAIGAARRGARVLVVEYQEGLGGVGTLGLIGRPYHGRNEGFAKEVPFPGVVGPNKDFSLDDKMEWYRREIRKAGGEVWFGVLGAGAFVEGDRVRGAVVVTPQGRGVLLGRAVIDATGNADVAAAAGAETLHGADATDLAFQGTGLPARRPNATYTNTDYLLVDETDAVDVWRAFVGTRLVMQDSDFDAGTLIQSRERRRVRGDHVLSYLDQIAGRTYPDTICYSASDYDSHGYPSDDFFALLPHDAKSRAANHPAPGGTCYTPYRCLLPQGFEGLLVTGLGMSMHRDASALVRMQRDLSNQGYAAGVAAAMAAAGNGALRAVDLRALQRHLVEIGSLPPAVLDQQDNFPLPEARVRTAVEQLAMATNPKGAGESLAVILSHRTQAQPLLRAAYTRAEGDARLTYARVLGFLGEREVIPLLRQALDAVTTWDGRILQGKMAEYAHLPTPIDSLILALGRTGDRAALPALLRKLETLDADVTLSHHRALASALETIGDPAATEPLARLLAKPGMRGHAMTSVEPLHDKNMELRRRLGPLREIALARALYRCGDHLGLGEAILREYRADLRGLFVRHAAAVLETAPAPRRN